jgi:hypothetical protein
MRWRCSDRAERPSLFQLS